MKAFAIIDSITYVAGLMNHELKLQPIWYAIILLIGFLWGNYELFSDNISELDHLNQHKPFFEVGFIFPHQNENGVLEISLDKIIDQEIKPILDSKYKKLKEKKTIEENKNKEDFRLEMVLGLKEINRNYEIEVDRHIKELEEYLLDIRRLNLMEKRLVLFEPEIKNSGHLNATKTRVEFIFPDPLYFPSKKDLIWREYPEYFPNPPKEPDLFKSMVLEMPEPLFRDLPFSKENSYPVEKKNISGPHYLENNTISYEIENLIPGFVLKGFDTFYLWFDKVEKINNLIIFVKIFSAELPDPQDDKISILLSVCS